MDFMDPVFALQSSFLVASISIVVAKQVSFVSDRFLAYGSRENKVTITRDNTLAPHLVNLLSSVRVPHSWFLSFYVVSTACSLLWAYQVMAGGGLFHFIAAATSAQSRTSSMTLDQVITTWCLMLLQGLRRLYESLTFTRASSSQMWIGHWAFGVWFYISVNLAVWIEGSSTLIDNSHELQHIGFRHPSLRTFVSILVFILASGIQHDCHVYLASLKKYSLPEHPVFQSIVCPHYLAECLIYLALSLNAAPPGYILNHTILCALILVTINLGITADGTKKWYEQKFGIMSVKDRWRLIPMVY